MKVFLLGLPGSGKSYWGEKLAHHVKLTFLDLDAEIEKKTGKTITEIFKQEGENTFRAIESQVLNELCNIDDDFVLACGGGTPCFNSNMDIIKQHGQSVYLNSSVEMVLKNLENKKEVSKRPLFQKEDLTEKIQSLLKERQSFYKKADHIIEIDRLTNTNILNQLIKLIAP